MNIFILFMLFTLAYTKHKVLLKDVNVLTLHHGKMTNGRRSSPVPQLECISGGSAPCSAFIPRVVQCINRGSDGYDVQWECKSDMDNTFRFGHVEINCEGYDYPDDPYILHGSCGLKYFLDYTQEGMNQNSQHNYGNNYDNSYSYNSHSTYGMNKLKSSSIIADVIVYIACGLMIYAFYKTCISTDRSERDSAYSSTNDDYPSNDGRGGGGYGWFGGTNPSAPHNDYSDASCRNRRSNNATGGFWTGAATGGLLGYMFGQRQNWWGGGGTRTGYWNTPRYSGGGSSWFNSGYSGNGFSQRNHSSGSSGTRTASGFGGTSRR